MKGPNVNIYKVQMAYFFNEKSKLEHLNLSVASWLCYSMTSFLQRASLPGI